MKTFRNRLASIYGETKLTLQLAAFHAIILYSDAKKVQHENVKLDFRDAKFSNQITAYNFWVGYNPFILSILLLYTPKIYM